MVGMIEGDYEDTFLGVRSDAASRGVNYVVLDGIDDDELIGRGFHCPSSYEVTSRERLKTKLPKSAVRVTNQEPPATCTLVLAVQGESDRNYEELREQASEVGANVVVLDGLDGGDGNWAMTAGEGGMARGLVFGGGSADMLGRAYFCQVGTQLKPMPAR